MIRQYLKNKYTIQRSPLQQYQYKRRIALAIVFICSFVFMIGQKNQWNAPLMFYSLSAMAIMLMALGRYWASSYIAGYKKEQLIMTGPYSINRNPLYHFSLIGCFGIMLVSGSVIASMVSTIACFFIYHWVIKKEEPFLQEIFQDEYKNYCQKIPRWGVSLTHYNKERTLPHIHHNKILIHKTLKEALLFLLIIPIHYMITLAQTHIFGSFWSIY